MLKILAFQIKPQHPGLPELWTPPPPDLENWKFEFKTTVSVSVEVFSLKRGMT